MINNLTQEQKREFTKVLESLGQSLDISETQYNALVRSYEAVGKWLQDDPVLALYNPVVSPQGSLRLGTIIQPVSDEDDIDIDLVFRLTGKGYSWTQQVLKNLVGARLKSHDVYKKMLDEEGKRCWTLLYRQNSENKKERYHMDILPCVANKNYSEEYRTVSATVYNQNQMRRIAIRITDTQHPLYTTSINSLEWRSSNPDGYALWFADRCKSNKELREMIVEDIVPVRKYNANKTVLQRIVQILKRHRDIKFYQKGNKPISIIITTLAAKAYKGETNILEGLINVVSTMQNYIEKDKNGNDAVFNPLNQEENFADKWIEVPEKRKNFYEWLDCAKRDIKTILASKGVEIWNNIGNSFGRGLSESANKSYTSSYRASLSNGGIKMATTGIMGVLGQVMNAANTFHGE